MQEDGDIFLHTVSGDRVHVFASGHKQAGWRAESDWRCSCKLICGYLRPNGIDLGMGQYRYLVFGLYSWCGKNIEIRSIGTGISAC